MTISYEITTIYHTGGQGKLRLYQQCVTHPCRRLLQLGHPSQEMTGQKYSLPFVRMTLDLEQVRRVVLV